MLGLTSYSKTRFQTSKMKSCSNLASPLLESLLAVLSGRKIVFLMSFLADLLIVFLFFLALKVTDLQSTLFKVTMVCKTQLYSNMQHAVRSEWSFSYELSKERELKRKPSLRFCLAECTRYAVEHMWLDCGCWYNFLCLGGRKVWCTHRGWALYYAVPETAWRHTVVAYPVD